MARSVLYFPYMDVPADEWFARVLLYWETVGTIIPTYGEDELELREFTRSLLERDLVRAVSPGSLDRRSLQTSFMRLLDEDPRVASLPRIDEQGTKTTVVATDKLTQRLADALVSRGLAKQKNFLWYEVEEYVAGLFMAYLAAALSAGAPNDMAPITNDPEALQLFLAPPSTAQTLWDSNTLRMEILEDVLPAPAGVVEVDDLVRFKERHGDRLSSFRIAIERALIELVKIDDLGVRQLELATLKEELSVEISSISEQLGKKWRNRAEALWAVVANTAPTAGAVLAHDVGGVLDSMSPLVKAIGRAAGEARGQELLASPMAYAALAKTNFVRGMDRT